MIAVGTGTWGIAAVIPKYLLLTVKLQHLAFFQPTLQVVVYLYRTYACWCSCVKYVACLQCEELRYIGYNLVNLVEHVACATLLHCLSVNVKVEVYALYVEELLLGHPLSDCR